MPTPMDVMLGLVVIAIGLLALVVTFTVQDSRKRMISYGIALLIGAFGFYYYVSAGMRGFKMRRRISGIQRQQKVNLEQIQKRLRQAQSGKKATKVRSGK